MQTAPNSNSKLPSLTTYVPIDDEFVEGRRLVAHGADPGGLLLVHQQEGGGVKAL